MKSLILCIVLPFTMCNLINNCNQKLDSSIRNCDTLDYKSAEYIYLFQMESDTSYLDSAIILVNIALSRCVDKCLQKKLKLRKLGLLAEKKEYQEALEFINRSIGEDVMPGLPYYKRFLINRFNAMYYQNNGEHHNRDSCISIIVFDIEDFLNQNEREVSQLKKQTDALHLLESPIFISVMQYYFYKSVLMGNTAFETKLKEKLSKGRINDFFYFEVLEFIETLDLMYFGGF